MGFFSDLLGGQNKWQIDNEYKKQRDALGSEMARSFFSDLENSSLYNNNKDYFNSIGITENPYSAENRMANDNAYQNALGSLDKERASAWRKNKFNIAGNGLVGAIVNPLIQTGDLAGDMFASPFRALAGEETNRYKRDPEKDFISDIGAVGDTALNFASAGTLGAGAKGAGTTLGAMKNMGKIGAAGSFFNTLREEGGDAFAKGGLALNTLIGGAMGAGIGGLTSAGGKLWNKYATPNSMANTPLSASKELIPYDGGGANYQNALKVLNENGLDTTTADALKKSYRKAVTTIHPDRGGNESLFKAVSGAYDTMYGKDGADYLQNLLKATSTGGATANTPVRFGTKLKTFASNIPTMGKDLANSKAGTKVSGLLKSKTGKVGAGIGGGLLLANMLRGGGGNNATTDANTLDLSQLSDEELYYLITEGGNYGY